MYYCTTWVCSCSVVFNLSDWIVAIPGVIFVLVFLLTDTPGRRNAVFYFERSD